MLLMIGFVPGGRDADARGDGNDCLWSVDYGRKRARSPW